MISIGKIKEILKNILIYTPIEDEIKWISRQIKRDKKDVQYFEREIIAVENKLLLLNEKLKFTKYDIEQLETWKNTLNDRIELKTIKIIDLATGKGSKNVELQMRSDEQKKRSE